MKSQVKVAVKDFSDFSFLVKRKVLQFSLHLKYRDSMRRRRYSTEKQNYFDILYPKIHNIHLNIDCTQHHQLLVCNYIARYNNHKHYYHFQLYYIHTAYNHGQILDANIHLQMSEMIKM